MGESKKGLDRAWPMTEVEWQSPVDPDEIPEQTEEDFARGTVHIAGVPVKRGRPKSTHPKESITIRLDTDLVAYYRKTGSGWQSRINSILRKAARLGSKETAA